MSEYASQYRGPDSLVYPYTSIWDASKLYGCVCDTGYSGYDCSLSKL